ncbi:hypothetical protein MUN82_05580 [Hymenobacter aerilatus]|uniref:HTTM domain-containing protein n=1 Tax=Hymenobacter aerilatus TaxID=2932251 RepID=A0A8T9T380_9BACT|nr:hypothetical protein [Hymenobacter aerilatus]UOR06566.1 hypothetical protein MUN82_05580 [Hymenobacter aerilatus]
MHSITSTVPTSTDRYSAAPAATPPSADAAAAADTTRYAVFCALWAIATLFHMAQSRLYTTQLHYLLLTLAALAVLSKPSSIVRLLVLIGLQLYEVFSRLPDISNHWLFTTFVNLTILQALVWTAFKERRLSVDRAALLRAFAPAVRLELLILYFFVVLHKLNWAFLSPSASCAAMLYKAQHAEALLPDSPALILANIYLTLAIETLIPVLLIFRKTRNIGLVIGLFFHCIIAFNSYNGFYDFSSMIFATYFLFTSYSFITTLHQFRNNLLSFWHAVKQRFSQFTFSHIALWVILAVVLLGSIKLFGKVFTDYFRLVWGAYSFMYILLLLFSLYKARQYFPTRLFSPSHALFLLFPLLVFLNGISPYLGLKTESSFAMFSNLRTEGGITNHLFIPVSAQVFDFQKDMIEVVASSDAELQRVADEGKLITFFQFKNRVADARPARVEYLRNGQRRTFALATASPNDELLHKSPSLLRKFMRFRMINKVDPQPCQH